MRQAWNKNKSTPPNCRNVVKASRKYRRPLTKYRPDLRWRQVICTVGFLAACLQAWDKSRGSGRREPIRGFGGWYMSNPGEDLE